MAKLIHLFLLAIIIGAFVIPEEVDSLLLKKLLKKKLLLAKKALLLVKPKLAKLKKLAPLAAGAALIAPKLISRRQQVHYVQAAPQPITYVQAAPKPVRYVPMLSRPAPDCVPAPQKTFSKTI